jgi:hypothetical protein
LVTESFSFLLFQVAVMQYDGTPVSNSGKVRLSLDPTYVTDPDSGSSASVSYVSATQSPSGGIAEFQITMDKALKSLVISVCYYLL